LNLVKFHGGAGTVTGSCFEVRHNGVRFLVDCGLFQGSRETREQNCEGSPE
jgi:metallo-beta-lactamase family protein